MQRCSEKAGIPDKQVLVSTEVHSVSLVPRLHNTIPTLRNKFIFQEEDRLAMLEQKSQLERDRAELARQKVEMQKNEQQAILNKSGNARAPIKFKFGK